MRHIEFVTTKKYEREFRERFGKEGCNYMIMADIKSAVYKVENDNDLKRRSFIIYTAGPPYRENEAKFKPVCELGFFPVQLFPMQFLIPKN